MSVKKSCDCTDDMLTRKLHDEIHCLRRLIILIFAKSYLLSYLAAYASKCIIIFCHDPCKGLIAVIPELLFYGKGSGDIISLIHGLVGDEAVHLRSVAQKFQCRRDNNIKNSYSLVRVLSVVLLDILLGTGNIYGQLHICLVIASVRIHEWHNIMHGVDISKFSSVPSVSKSSLSQL